MDRLSAPSFWIGIFAVLAVMGILAVIAGKMFDLRMLVLVGMALGAPLVVGAVLALVAAVPYVLWQMLRSRDD
jgi:hypothetical protein